MYSSPATIGERIKNARRAAHISQTKLAKLLGKTMRTVQKYESGEIAPSIAIMNQISDILDVPLEDLMGYRRPTIRLETIADIIMVLAQLNRKAGIHFDISVKHKPDSDDCSCSMTFDNTCPDAKWNDTICYLLEEFEKHRDSVEAYWLSSEGFDNWIEQKLSYYADAKLEDKKIEELSTTDRLKRMLEFDKQNMEKAEKASAESSKHE